MRISDWSSDVCSTHPTIWSTDPGRSVQQLHEIPHRHRVAEPVTLREVAAAFTQDVVLAFLLHALGDDGDAQRVGHRDDRGGQGQVVRVAQHVGDEAAVDLHSVDRYPAQVAQAGEAGAEVVQPHLDPGAAQAPEQGAGADLVADHGGRSEEHTSELQSLMRISYAVFCLKKKKQKKIMCIDVCFFLLNVPPPTEF